MLREAAAVALQMGNTLNFHSQVTHLIPLHGMAWCSLSVNKGGFNNDEGTFLVWDKV